jgi:two-component system response regulator AtoC
MPLGRVLIVDDDPAGQEILRACLEPFPLEIQVADGPEAATRLLATEQFHVVLCDLVMDGGGGLAVLRFVESQGKQTPVIIVTGYGDEVSADECLAAGAFEFISKPFDRQSLVAIVRRAVLRSGLILKETFSPTSELRARRFPFLIGDSQPMREVYHWIAKVAEVDANVCVYGESGTGKELVARAIHYSSRRADRPLVVFDCTTVSEGLMESEMFGHVKGAFTSAVTDRDGVFQLADGGTIFLDEVGELSVALQGKLLRVIQSREFRKVGGRHPIKVNVRIIAATNKDLQSMVAQGTFREDLLYRLEVIPITLPPLRQHKEDIPVLVDYFIQRFNRNNRKQIRRVSPRTMAALFRYHWPGNVRQLENCVERTAVMCDGKVLEVENPAQILRWTGGTPPPPPPTEDIYCPCRLKESRQDAERELILKTLRSVNGNRTHAADLLGISLRALQYKLKALLLTDVVPPQSNGRSKQNGLKIANIQKARLKRARARPIQTIPSGCPAFDPGGTSPGSLMILEQSR